MHVGVHNCLFFIPRASHAAVSFCPSPPPAPWTPAPLPPYLFTAHCPLLHALQQRNTCSTSPVSTSYNYQLCPTTTATCSSSRRSSPA